MLIKELIVIEKSIIIIGAGIAGLAAGCYGQMNGYRTEIFELHDLPGGLCTAWKRKGYTFDGCIHWLVGSSPANSFYKIWKELGAVQGREIVNHDEFFRIETPAGKTLILYTDADRLERHLKEFSPRDGKVIGEMMQAVRKLGDVEIPSGGGFLDGMKSMAKLLPSLRFFVKYGRISTREFAKRFQDPFLRDIFESMFSIPDFPMIALLMTLGWQHRRAAGYPIGGSLKFAQAIEGRYLKLGGKIHYKSRADKILVHDGRAVGVRLADGTEHRADRVISAADGHATIFDMLEGKFLNEEIERNYKEMPIFAPIIQVSLGVARDFTKEPHMVTIPLSEPLKIGGEMRDEISLKHYCYDPTMAPTGKSALVMIFNSNYDYWKKFAADPEAYRAEKESVAQQVVDALEKRFPGIREQIEVSDVATPLTFERYTGNWQGSMEGWLITTKTLGKKIPQVLPGLSRFYMIGQWIQPGGGLPPAAQSGRDIIRKICKEDGQRFTTRIL